MRSPPDPVGSTDAAAQAAHNAGRLPAELAKLRRIGLLVVNEVGYIPFEQDAANLFFQLVSSRYERASLILTSNLPFARWGDLFGDQVVAAAMIDRIVHHADILTLKEPVTGSRTLGSTPCPPPVPTTHGTITTDHVAYFSPLLLAYFRPSSTTFGLAPSAFAGAAALMCRLGYQTKLVEPLKQSPA